MDETIEQFVTLLDRSLRQNAETLDGDELPPNEVFSAIDDAEAAFADDGLDAVLLGEDCPDDAERVLFRAACHERAFRSASAGRCAMSPLASVPRERTSTKFRATSLTKAWFLSRIARSDDVAGGVTEPAVTLHADDTV